MTAPIKTTTVQMPAAPDLFPAHVVAIRPDVEEVWSNRGDYVLTVNTPRGTRNVVSSADGFIDLHVELMQDVEPGTVLFVIDPSEEPLHYFGEDYEGLDEEPDAPRRNIPPPPPRPSAAETPRAVRKTGGLFWLYLSFCMVLAALWPGVIYAFSDPGGAEPADLFIAAGAGGMALVALVLLLGVVPFLAGLKKTGLLLGSSVLVFALSFAAGIYQPDVESLHRKGVATVLKPFVPVFDNVEQTLSVKTAKRSETGGRGSQPEKATYPDLMAMLSAPMGQGHRGSRTQATINNASAPPLKLHGAANYGPIMEMIAIPFNRH